ncbi:MAG: DUF998 domain-containing protein [Chloroflexota bacterium]
MIPEKKQPINLSYKFLRRMVGVLGMLLPVILYFGRRIVFQEPLMGSISEYYHTGMGDVFVGILCVTGFFLYSYRGYEGEIDGYLSTVGGLLALGVAFFPTSAELVPVTGNAEIDQYAVRALPEFVGRLHLLFAVGFFAVLAYFCLFLFTKTADPLNMTPQKKIRNRIYQICGWIIIVSLVLAGIYIGIGGDAESALAPLRPVFWLEAIAIEAFGFSWLVKGETLFTDDFPLDQ